jgi:LacI family transcriptional regulator
MQSASPIHGREVKVSGVVMAASLAVTSTAFNAKNPSKKPQDRARADAESHSRRRCCASLRLLGIDNHGAGVTAAYLMDQWLGSAPSDVLITLSRTVFRGEGEREVGFRSALRGSGREIVEVSDSDGIDATNERLALEALEKYPTVEAVYSVGGGNSATVAAFERLGRVCRVFIAHDLDADNRRLLREGRISVVLHNDLRADARTAMRLILQERGALPAEPTRPVPIQVITPYNVPG